MANTASAKKAARQAVKRRARNMSNRSKLRTSVKKVRTLLAEGNKADAASAMKEAGPIIDTAARKGLIHPNAAARYKSRINRQLKATAG